MSHLVVLVGLAATVVAVSAVARRLGFLSPILLMLVGIGLSFIEPVPAIRLEPELILIGILPPLLYVAAIETSVPAFRYNLRPILLLAVGLVLFTAACVGFAVHALLGVPLAIAFALGAVVAPPDAVAATAIARRIGLPRRVVTILEGESLINDATALVTLRVAVLAATGHAITVLEVTREAVVASAGGVAVGLLGGFVIAWIHRRVTDPLIDNTISLITPFAVYVPAEQIHASGVVAVVVAGLHLGHRFPQLMSARSRLQMDAFWRMVRFLLEGAVFLLVGLQLRFIVADLDTAPGVVAVTTVTVLAIVIVARFAWLYPATYLGRLLPRVRARAAAKSAKYPTIIAWAGMRGVVTLAAALALPPTLAGGAPYPRDLFVWIAFSVIVGTLLLQGITLPAAARLLRVPADDPKEDALAEAAVQQAAARAARERLDAEAAKDGPVPESVLDRLRELITHRTNLAWERLGGQSRETPSQAYGRLRRGMLDAERNVFRRARDEGRIPEEVLRRAQRDMDLEESMLEREEQ